jgi:7-cyano-7-deazaguanine synthase
MKVVLSLSGGLDSTALFTSLIREHGYVVQPIIFTYDSKHNRYENKAAMDVCNYFKLDETAACSVLDPMLLDISAVMSGFRSALLKTGGPIPEGHYNDETMSQTVVPGRNAIFISILAGLAESIDASMVAIAVHQGDHHIYPDCRPKFIKAIDRMVRLSSDQKVGVMAPFLHLTKADIVAAGEELSAPFHLTRTCYKDYPIACGKCGSCRERLEAFEINNMTDPIYYQ